VAPPSEKEVSPTALSRLESQEEVADVQSEVRRLDPWVDDVFGPRRLLVFHRLRGGVYRIGYPYSRSVASAMMREPYP